MNNSRKYCLKPYLYIVLILHITIVEADYILVGGGTFSIVDSAVTPNNLVMFSDAEFLSFDVSLTLSTGDSSTYTLGIDDFQEGDAFEMGILFDAVGNPFRFELPGYFTSNFDTMCEPLACYDYDRSYYAWLALHDNDAFEKVYLSDGTIDQLSNLSPGTPYTPLAGDWSYRRGVNIGGSGIQKIGIYEISAVPVPPALWLFGSGLLGLVGLARKKKVA